VKVLDRSALLAALAEERAEGRTIALANGLFDLLHVGHLRYLEGAAAEADVLVVAVNSDASARRLKGVSRPIVAAADRVALLAALAAVDLAVVFDEDTPERLIRAVEPDVLVKGGDWPIEKIVGREVVQGRGGKVVAIPFVKNRSTTALIGKIRGTMKPAAGS